MSPMPRRVSPRRLVAAAALVMLAVVPNVVEVRAAVANDHLPASKIAWVLVRLPLNPRLYYLFDVSSLESAKAIASGWGQYRRWSWVFALVAARADRDPRPQEFAGKPSSCRFQVGLPCSATHWPKSLSMVSREAMPPRRQMTASVSAWAAT